MSRRDLATAVATLRRRNFTTYQIAAELHISVSYARELATDPEGTNRRARFAGECTECGRATHSPGYTLPAPTLCRKHHLAARRGATS